MKLLIIICERNKTKFAIDLLNKNDVNYHLTFYGKGTADSEMLSYLGLTDTRKEIIFSILKSEITPQVIEVLENAKAFKAYAAVAFAVPLDAISKSTLSFIGN